MAAENRRRTGEAVARRMTELGLTITQLAQKAGVDPTTIRALIGGTRWLREDTRERIITALGWPPGEISRRMYAEVLDLADVPTVDLVRELCRRFGDDHGVREVPG